MPRLGPPDPKALKSFVELNIEYSTLVSMMQVGMDMAPTSTQIATWESDCANYNRTVTAWQDAEQQITNFNAMLVKNQLPALTASPTKLTKATCSFTPEAGRKPAKQTSPR
jgi:hypothetical protein